MVRLRSSLLKFFYEAYCPCSECLWRLPYEEACCLSRNRSDHLPGFKRENNKEQNNLVSPNYMWTDFVVCFVLSASADVNQIIY